MHSVSYGDRRAYARGASLLAVLLPLPACGGRTGLELWPDGNSSSAAGRAPSAGGATSSSGGKGGAEASSTGAGSSVAGTTAVAGAPSTPLTATAISTSQNASCALLHDGTVRCWGQRAAEDSVNGAPQDRTTVPAVVAGISGAATLTISSDHGCSIVNSGAVACWGSNAYAQLGDGTQAQRAEPVLVTGITTATSVAAGEDFTCAALADGTVLCWGFGGFGELGNGMTGYANAPNVLPLPGPALGIKQALAVAAGTYHVACTLLQDGGVSCWGANDYGELGSGKVTPYDSILYPVPVFQLSDATSVSVGGVGACALSKDGTARCWGRNNHGQLGNGTLLDSAVPVLVGELTDVVALSCGNVNACAVTKSGNVRCWGSNGFGQLGDGTMTDSVTPVSVVGIDNAIAVSVRAHACALLATGSIRCWGQNDHGQLGNGTTTNSSVPVTVSGF
jgi:alpha-tubulin suppressor-like RCC1 family protein